MIVIVFAEVYEKRKKFMKVPTLFKELLEMGWNDVFECRISKINPDAHYENQIRLTIRIKINEGR